MINVRLGVLSFSVAPIIMGELPLFLIRYPYLNTMNKKLADCCTYVVPA